MDCRIGTLCFGVAFFLQTMFVSPACGDDESESSRLVRQWHQFYRQRAAELALEETRGKHILTLVSEPIQSWTNPIRGDTQHGTVHLWTLDGRPQAIGSIWSALDAKDRTQRNLCYEFHSLSESPLAAKHREQLWWAPQDPGIQRIDLKDVPEPGGTRAVRLRQMRDFARELQAELNGQEASLRLLPQPVYRYPEKVPGVLDGAIFSFVIATDPEAFVILEMQDAQTFGEMRWMLAPVRFTGDPLRIRRGEQVLWDSSQWEYRRNKIYDFLYGIEHYPDAMPPIKSAE